MNLIKYVFCAGMSFATCVVLTACTQPKVKTDEAKSSPVPATDINVFVQKPLAGWHITVADLESQKELTGNSVVVDKVPNSKVPKSEVMASLTAKAGSDDAITLRWNEAWRAAISIDGGAALNLQPYIANGVLSFDINVKDLAQGGLAFTLNCGKNCERTIPYLIPGRELIGKGWQHLAFSMRCFVRDGDNFSAVTKPFGLESSGAGDLSIANVKFEMNATANATCPDYKTVSVTPSMLNEAWSISWWQPRHEQKLIEKQGKKVDLIFIGDSITHGWEKEGLNIWNKYYGKRNALDLGFSGDRTENVLWRLQHGEVDGLNPKVAVLMFGTNNTGHRLEDPKTTAAGIKRNIDELQQRLPNTKILLLAIFPREEFPDGQMRQINNDVNAIIAGFADNKKIFFLDVGPKFLDNKGVLSKNIMPDLLHPNEKGYEIWASAMEPTLSKLFH